MTLGPALGRLAGRTPFRLAVFSLLAAALVWPILPDAAKLNEFRDVHHLFFYERAAIDTISRFGELPLWNPWYCGGFDAVGAPQTRFMSPTLLLGLVFGAERAEILTVFFFTVLGMEGMYRWLRLRVPSAAAAMCVAPVFALSGQYAVAYYRGWIQFFGFELVPWILLGVTLAARRRLAGVAIASVAFAWMLGFAGFFAAPLVAVAAIIEALRALADEPRGARGRSLAMLAVTVSFMAMVSWGRLWPVAETLLSAPRIMAGTPGHTAKGLLSAAVGTLTVKDMNTDVPGSFFVGSAFLALVVLGGQDRRAARALAVVVLFIWFAAGYARSPSLFGLLRELPVFSALRYPERFLWLAILFASEPAALALAKVPHVGEGTRWRTGTWLVLGSAVAWTIASQVASFHRVAAARTLGFVTELRDVRPEEFRQSRGNRWLTVHVQAAGLGSLSCYETHRLAQSPLLRADLPAEEYLAPSADGAGTAGTVKRTGWSPNRVSMRVEVPKPSRVLVNQNWAPGWHASVGTVVSHEGLLAVDVPSGTHQVTLSFLPWSTAAGAAVTVTALLALGALAWRARRRGEPLSRRQLPVTAGAVLAPWAVAAAAYAGSPDPKWPPPVPTNPDRTPALVEVGAAAAGGATEIGATFANGLALEAGRVKGPDEHGNLLIDAYLKRTGSLPRSTTMFVHVERRKSEPKASTEEEDFFNVDHQVVGGSFYLSDMPAGRAVHDAAGVHLAKAAKGTWDVWIAFGHVSGRRGRVPVTDKGKADTSDDRVRVGTFTVD